VKRLHILNSRRSSPDRHEARRVGIYLISLGVIAASCLAKSQAQPFIIEQPSERARKRINVSDGDEKPVAVMINDFGNGTNRRGYDSQPIREGFDYSHWKVFYEGWEDENACSLQQRCGRWGVKPARYIDPISYSKPRDMGAAENYLAVPGYCGQPIGAVCQFTQRFNELRYTLLRSKSAQEGNEDLAAPWVDIRRCGR
jgi:hypothetical protein